MVPDFLTIAEAARLIAEAGIVAGRTGRQPARSASSGSTAGSNSFIRVLADEARADARTAEAEIAAGRYKGPLHGIPIGLKDIYETAGVATTGHSKVMQDHVPKADAVLGQRGCATPARCRWASWRRMNSPLAGPASTCPGRRRATRGTRRASPAARRAAPAPRSPRGWCWAAPAATPAARSAARRPIAASPASSRPTG